MGPYIKCEMCGKVLLDLICFEVPKAGRTVCDSCFASHANLCSITEKLLYELWFQKHDEIDSKTASFIKDICLKFGYEKVFVPSVEELQKILDDYKVGRWITAGEGSWIGGTGITSMIAKSIREFLKNWRK